MDLCENHRKCSESTKSPGHQTTNPKGKLSFLVHLFHQKINLISILENMSKSWEALEELWTGNSQCVAKFSTIYHPDWWNMLPPITRISKKKEKRKADTHVQHAHAQPCMAQNTEAQHCLQVAVYLQTQFGKRKPTCTSHWSTAVV